MRGYCPEIPIMDLFCSELKFWWRRQVKAWSLPFGVLLCAGLSYFPIDSVRNSIIGIRLSHRLHESPDGFYLTTGLTVLLWLVPVLLTAFKAISVIWPAEVELGTTLPVSAHKADPAVWPPAPKPPK